MLVDVFAVEAVRGRGSGPESFPVPRFPQAHPRHVWMTTLTGILQWPQRAEGRLRQLAGTTIVERDDDPFVPLALCERFKLRHGLRLTVEVGFRKPSRRRRRRGGDRRPRPVVETILQVEGMDPEKFASARSFEDLTSIDPQPRLTLEYPGCPASCRLIDLFCPIGRGQRGLIVSPPKAGKTTLLKDIGLAILRNHPDVHVMVMLIDERPEEVTDFRRTFADYAGVPTAAAATGPLAAGAHDGQLTEAPGAAPSPPPEPRCRVIGSSNDHDVEQHIATATVAIERCKRMVEAGRHVVVVLDSITRLGRAFNRSRRHASSGRTMSGGIDSRALEVPKMIFGSARCTEEAGTLTMIASCLVDTGSVGDQLIFEEFKGTGNMELILDRKISERRIFPAINLAASGTRKEHLLMGEQELKTVTALRRRLMNMPPHLQVEQLLAALQRFPTNAALVGSAG
jgi:transcription termination factor Rho